MADFKAFRLSLRRQPLRLVLTPDGPRRVCPGFEEVAQSAAAQGGMLMLVDINFDFLDRTVVPVNLSMPVYMRNRIDKAARERGLTRSAFLVQAVQAYALKSA